MRKPTVLTAMSILAISTLALVGCAKEPGDVAARPTVAPTPSPTVEAHDDPSPLPIGGLDCDGVLPVEVVSKFLPGAVREEYVAPTMYFSNQVRAVGGLACEWTNGEARPDDSGNPRSFAKVAFTALPDGQGDWDKLVQQGQQHPPACHDTGYCWGDLLIDGYWWVSLEAESSETASPAENKQSFEALVARLRVELTDTDRTRGGWTEPAGTLSIDPACGSLLGAADIAEIAGTSSIFLETVRDGGGIWFVGEGVDARLGTSQCHWYTDEGLGLGEFSALVGGSWAYDEALGRLDATPAELAGLRGSDEAVTFCTTYQGEYCTLNISIGHNLVELRVWSEVVPDESDRVRLLKKLGERLVANAYA